MPPERSRTFAYDILSARRPAAWWGIRRWSPSRYGTADADRPRSSRRSLNGTTHYVVAVGDIRQNHNGSVTAWIFDSFHTAARISLRADPDRTRFPARVASLVRAGACRCTEPSANSPLGAEEPSWL
ncbi:hypothetical protein GCM10010344_57860 [Streptomyces bluensis]|nr:hypothetical protein GCM10010344_57860 [Streptomyces bluensis]